MTMSPNELAIAYQPVLRSVARSYMNILSFDDAYGYGNVGLAKAAMTWNEEMGCAFATMAKRLIRNAIVDGIRSERGKTGAKVKFRPVYIGGWDYGGVNGHTGDLGDGTMSECEWDVPSNDDTEAEGERSE